MSQHRSQLYKHITESFRFKHEPTKVLTWLIDDCLGSFGIPIIDEPPQDIVSELFDLSGLFAKCVIEDPFSDILGSLYMEISSKWSQKGMGQYFTPPEVAKMMAMIQDPVTGLKRARDAGYVYAACEPTAGSGVMLLAMIDTIMQDDEGVELLSWLSLTGIDIDLLCVKMTTLQILANAMLHDSSVGELAMYHGSALGDTKDLKRFCYANHRRWEETGVPHDPKRFEKADIISRPGEQFDLF